MTDFEGFELMEINSNLVLQVSVFSIGFVKITSWVPSKDLYHVLAAGNKHNFMGAHASESKDVPSIE